ncbi:MAG: UDP-N-acetyl glucosamine 2-epimerase [Holophaga sp.]|jgi:UDP-N-acetylglucosamine 2-epimerase (non-hydrolysing)
MKKLKVMTVVGTRPEIIRLSRVLVRLDQDTDHCLVHTGQNYDYELTQVFFEDLGLRLPDRFLDAAGASVAETIGNVIARTDAAMAEFQPEAFLVLGDTNSCLAVIPAKRRKIPIFHMEAGNRCFDHRVPEETNRRIVDHTSDLNLPYSALARENLLREGLPPDRVVRTGSPMYEVIHHYLDRIQASRAVETLGVAPGAFYLVSCHREENVDDQDHLLKFVDTLNQLAATRKRRIIVSTHPRTRKRLDACPIALDPLVELMKPMSFTDYVRLQTEAAAVLSDSGTITEESNILDFPALNIREAHERPEGMEEGAVMMTGLAWERVAQGLALLEQAVRVPGQRTTRLVRDYDAPNVSQTVVRIILSYTDYINRTVWHRS